MSEEIVAGEDQQEQAAEIVHEDIMQRLLDYQRQLREGPSPAEAAETLTPEEPPTIEASEAEPDIVVDLTQAEAELETADVVVVGEADEPAATGGRSTDLAARVDELEDTLARVSAMIDDLRVRFQELAIASDQQLAALDETVSAATRTRS